MYPLERKGNTFVVSDTRVCNFTAASGEFKSFESIFLSLRCHECQISQLFISSYDGIAHALYIRHNSVIL